MERGDRAEAVHPIEPSVNEVAQPLPIAPSTARERERKEVLAGYRAVPQDPFTGAHMYASVWISQHGCRAAQLPVEQHHGQRESQRGKGG